MTRRPGTHLQAEVSLPPGFDPPSAALVTSVPSRPKPTGDTRAGDLRYNIMVRLGNMGCTCPVDHLDTEALTEHWESHCRAGRPQRFGLGAASWIEVTTMGSREREWLPPHPPPELAGPSFCMACGKDLGWCECETVQPTPPGPDRRTLLARQYDRVGGPAAGDLADKREWLPPRFRAAAELGHYPADGPCVDCGMHDEPTDRDRRCRFCAELVALRPKVPVVPLQPLSQVRSRSWPGSPRLTLCAVVLLAMLCASVVLDVPAAALALLALLAGCVLMMATKHAGRAVAAPDHRPGIRPRAGGCRSHHRRATSFLEHLATHKALRVWIDE